MCHIIFIKYLCYVTVPGNYFILSGRQYRKYPTLLRRPVMTKGWTVLINYALPVFRYQKLRSLCTSIRINESLAVYTGNFMALGESFDKALLFVINQPPTANRERTTVIDEF
jgi:hypothetical protein